MIKLVCFDLNETLIEENTWKNLNLALGVSPEEDESILKDYEEGRTTYEEGQERLEKIYLKHGLATKNKILETVNQYKYRQGAKEIIRYLKKKGYHIALLSGSIDLLVEKVARELDVDLFGSNNSFVFDKDNKLIEIKTEGRDSTIKVKQLKEFIDKLKIFSREVVCVGDGLSDQELFDLTKHGVTFKGSRIKDKAWKTIDKLEDLCSLL
ncbi:MAG: HAD family phosphatase [Candidatus Levybacteria bacterium]|nr:HAD family phosphatase [Candidatus Levybacteria bacterium]